MVNHIVGFNWGGLFAAIALVFWVFIIALVIICLIRASRYFMNAGKEQKLIRMELGKLAEEVHQLRHQLKGGGEHGAAARTE
ncbi:MAG TPA: hypothetical protein VMX13_04605 [Sedimentisphaerales bacterium]|nr:hypothetical protein [Sedimentisphaerales bacterium]